MPYIVILNITSINNIYQEYIMDKEIIHDSSFGAILFFKTKNAILFALIHHKAGHWAFPKGHQIKGETEIETARREIEEETGLKNVKIFANYFFSERYSFEEKNKLCKSI